MIPTNGFFIKFGLSGKQVCAYKMVSGVGIDMIEVERVEKSIGKGNGFREYIFSQLEIDYCETKTNKFEHYAARFAAKEAFYKALGTGWLDGTFFNEVQITNNDVGKPEISLLGGTAETISRMNLVNISVSLSHIKTMATAIVIIEK